MFALVATLLIVALVIYLIDMLPLTPPFGLILKALVVLIAIIMLLPIARGMR